MRLRALFAIVRERCRAERRTAFFCTAGAAIAGFVQPHGVWLAGAMFICSTIGIAFALLQGPGRYPYLDLCERSAPLFGRELARAKALVPSIVGLAATLAYWSAHSITGFLAPPVTFALAIGCVLASTLVALGATIRTGGARLLYIALAFGTCTTAYVVTNSGGAAGAAAELCLCITVAFIALRQYGETLARFDV
jgi:hypothetical protein